MEKASDVEQVVRDLYEAISNADVAKIESITCGEAQSLVIGTDPAEWWEGLDRIMRAWEAQLKEMGGVKVASENLQAYKEGTVGWIADQCKFVLSNASEIPVRLTAVLHDEGGEWKMVQAHASIGVPNTEAVGQELTT